MYRILDRHKEKVVLGDEYFIHDCWKEIISPTLLRDFNSNPRGSITIRRKTPKKKIG